MAVILDLVGSEVLAGFVVMLGLRMNATMAKPKDSYSADVNVHENLVSLVQSIEHDFRRMEYRVDDPLPRFVSPDT